MAPPNEILIFDMHVHYNWTKEKRAFSSRSEEIKLDQLNFFRPEYFLPEGDDGTGLVNRGVTSWDHADKHGEGEIINHLTPEKVKRDDCEEDCSWGDDRTA